MGCKSTGFAPPVPLPTSGRKQRASRQKKEPGSHGRAFSVSTGCLFRRHVHERVPGVFRSGISCFSSPRKVGVVPATTGRRDLRRCARARLFQQRPLLPPFIRCSTGAPPPAFSSAKNFPGDLEGDGGRGPLPPAVRDQETRGLLPSLAAWNRLRNSSPHCTA